MTDIWDSFISDLYGDPSKLNGLTVKFIDIDRDQIAITTECGRKFLFYHEQDCCESVRIYDSKGNSMGLGYSLDLPVTSKEKLYQKYSLVIALSAFFYLPFSLNHCSYRFSQISYS